MFTWPAHDEGVTALAFAAGGGVLVSAGRDGWVRAWDPLTGAERWATGLAAPVGAGGEPALARVAVDATGAWAAVGHRAHGVVFLDLGSGSAAGDFRLAEFRGLAPAPDGRTVFAAGRPADTGWFGVSQLRYPTGKAVAASTDYVYVDADRAGLAVSPDEAEVVVGTARLSWPAGRRAGPGVVARPTPGEYAVSADGDALFAPAGSRLGVWGFRTGAFRRRVKGHVAPITALASDGRRLWTASADATVKCWDVDALAVEKTVAPRAGPLAAVAVSPDGTVAAAGGQFKGTITVWDLL